VTLDKRGKGRQERRLAAGNHREARNRRDKPRQEVKFLSALSPVEVPIHVGIAHEFQQSFALRDRLNEGSGISSGTFPEQENGA
jgi:hypothetical protein